LPRRFKCGGPTFVESLKDNNAGKELLLVMAFVRIQWSERKYKALHSYNQLPRQTVIINALREKFVKPDKNI
jgi:hypothetical protein